MPTGLAAQRWAVRLALGVVLALVAGSTALSAPAVTAHSWFDQPLPSSHHPVGAVPITAHSTAPTGINAVELLIDGASVETLEYPDAPKLAKAEFDWQPLEERAYWLVVRGRSGEVWGPPAAILVIIGDPDASVAPSTSPSPSTSELPTTSPSPSPTPTATSSARPTPSPTPRRTASPTPCTLTEPALTSPENNSSPEAPVEDATPTLEWEYFGECQAGFRIEIYLIDQVGEPVKVGNVGAQVRQWTTPPLLNCQAYQWRVFAKKANGSLGPGSEIFSFYVKFQRDCP